MRILADQAKVAELTDRLAGLIKAEMGRSGPSDPWALVGLRSRGDLLAQRVADRLGAQVFGGRVGSLDFTLYRDDLSEGGAQRLVRTTEIHFGIDDLHVVLVDDVLMTGRSVRAALQSLMDLGRPRRVWLSVLVDRGGRELPIAADHVALDLTRPSAEHQVTDRELVEVQLTPMDERDAIVLRPGTRKGGRHK